MSFLSKLKAGLGLLALSSLTAVFANESKLNLREGVTEISREAYHLHNWVVIVMLVIAVVVFGAMAYSMWAHSKKNNPVPAKFSHSTALEILWTAIPFIILIVFAVPSTKLLMKQYDTAESDLTIVVKGYQWKWKYSYPDQELEYFSALATPRDTFVNSSELASTPIAAIGHVLAGGVVGAGDKPTEKSATYLLEVDHELVIPVGKKVRFLVTAEDVIHAFWVPDFGIKKDAIPGFINEIWARVEKPGIYRGQCAELCGKDHGFMPIVVRAVEPAEFDAWVAQKQEEKRIAAEDAAKAAASSFTMEQLMADGEKNYLARCAACHQPTGQGLPPTFPALAGSKIATGPVAGHLNIVINGKAGTAMQAFGAQLTDVEIASIITYERNAWGNNTGELVQPADVAAFKNGK
ncbi:cytochrome c oxidase subunit II [Permianibacter sp. IMCC34836]|uniref:cytochrome c oxidase subunit II n=1 Tax=Permianibacter fluminis TaxID=2738515 RepID=UPI001552E5A9|nr:cytochrome c oxidase subunit II [Permianibacter fluminis]NQD36910.1 cytochrome c oxidase subunit II [Permianibacter fluminis]